MCSTSFLAEEADNGHIISGFAQFVKKCGFMFFMNSRKPLDKNIYAWYNNHE